MQRRPAPTSPRVHQNKRSGKVMSTIDPTITGIGETPIGKHADRTTLDLAFQVADSAVENAELRWADIDGLVVTAPLVGAFPRHALAIAENFGISPQLRFTDTVSLGGASPLVGLVNADRAIRANDANNILVVAADTPRTGQTRHESVRHFAAQRHPIWEQPTGMLNVTAYALLAHEYLCTHELHPDSLIEFPLFLRRQAKRTTTAAYRETMTRLTALESRVVSSPLRLLECSPINDGAAALVISRNRQQVQRSVRLIGNGFATDYDSFAFKQDSELTAMTRAYNTASERAQLLAADCDFAMIYDSYSITLALQLEAIGISAPGLSTEDARSGRFELTGDLPINPHGGLLSHGHCGGASGMHHIVQLVRQLREEADNQVPLSKGVAMYQAEGGILSANASAFFELV